ncbi:MAG: zinc-ribbon domain-containing protein [Deltaproteobacteria bacterium]|nr:zinc-ribbon domain-containing protein [Deltaproteobacteria bacterium]
MIVRCANCHTEFSLDDQQIGPEGATVRCSVCSYVFAVDPPPGAGDQPWQIRTVEDLLFTAPDLATLQTWIVEGRLHPDDQVSRTGKHWLRLGDMPEFSLVFSGFSDLPQVFVEVEAPPSSGSALDQLGPPPSFGGAMPVVHGVDTSVLAVGPDGHLDLSDDDVPVGALSPAVERSRGEDPVAAVGARPPERPVTSETSAPAPFPMAQLGLEDDDPSGEITDESAVRMRPRPHLPTARVAAIPDVVEDDVVAEVRRRRPPRPTVRYGADHVHSSMLDAVTKTVDEADAETEVEVEAETTDVGGVRATAAAVERTASRDSEPVVTVRPRLSSAPRDSRESEDRLVAAGASGRTSSESSAVRARRRHRTFARGIDSTPKRRTWPIIAGLGLLAGILVVFFVPAVRDKVMSVADSLVGGERFDPTKLEEIEQARQAMVGLDPAAVGKTEAALQSRLDGGKVPPSGVAEMKLSQVELLVTRSIEHAIGRAAGAPGGNAVSDDVKRAELILGGVVVDDVVDREHMRSVRARMRLAQGRPAAEILPLLPEDGSGELRQLVAAAPLWREPDGPMPEGVVAGLSGLPERSALGELALSLAYFRADDPTNAAARAQAILDVVPGQPTAFALHALATAASGPEASLGDGSGDGATGEGATGAGATGDPSSGGTATDDGAAGSGTTGGGATGDDGDLEIIEDDDEPAAKVESTDSLIDRGCDLVESGDANGALELLRRAKARRPGDLDMLLCTGMAHARKGRTRKALQTYEQALRRSSNFVAALLEAAKAADKLGETEKALNYYRRVLGQRPGDAKAKAYVDAHG